MPMFWCPDIEKNIYLEYETEYDKYRRGEKGANDARIMKKTSRSQQEYSSIYPIQCTMKMIL